MRNTQKPSATSREYRPADYFGRKDMQARLLTSIKGTQRRKMLINALESGQIDEVPDDFKNAALDYESRQMIGQLHPSFMGGEYLPTAKPREIEIARISIDSTTGDVVSLYARVVGERIAYRVVDEYGGETLSARSSRTSMQPLTMGEMIDFFLQAWDLFVCLDCNFEGDVDGMLDFFTAESEFYPGFDDELRRLVLERFPPPEPEEEYGDDESE